MTTRLIVILLIGFLSQPAIAADDISHFDAGRENRAGLTYSPDGNSVYWVEWDGKWGKPATAPRTVYMSVKGPLSWTKPLPIPFSGGKYNDDDPFVSPDGEWLYFVSDRPTEMGGERADGNIWRYRIHVGRQLELVDVNSPGEEYSPVVTNSGSLYFASDREGGLGQGDIYVARASDEGFSEPVALGPSINSQFGEWNVWVSDDENLLILESSSRPTNVSIPGDLYGSIRCDGEWTEVVPLRGVNSTGSDLLPRVHPDGTTLFYTTAPIGGHARIESTQLGPALSVTCDD